MKRLKLNKIFNHKNHKNPVTKSFKILAIDGGGVKGYFPAYVIYKLKKEFDINVLEEFDFFVGTSIGSIITLSILKEFDIDKFMELFEVSSNIFHKTFPILDRLDKTFAPKYKNENLKQLLDNIFGETKIKDFKTSKPWALTLTNFTTGKPGIVGSSDIKGVNPKYKDMMIKDAILASTSAPGFLPTFENNKYKEYYLDGGLWANNPSFLAMLLANQSFNVDFKDISILSIATTDIENKEFFLEKGLKKLISFDGKVNEFSLLVSSIMNANQNSSSFFTSIYLENRHLRVSPNEGSISISKLDKINEKFKSLSKSSYEKQKHNIVDFIKKGKNSKYKPGEEKLYN